MGMSNPEKAALQVKKQSHVNKKLLRVYLFVANMFRFALVAIPHTLGYIQGGSFEKRGSLQTCKNYSR
jgi:hypothetical protein